MLEGLLASCSAACWGSVLGIAGVLYFVWDFFQPRVPEDLYPIQQQYLKDLKYIGKHASKIEITDINQLCSEMRTVFKSNVTRPLNARKKELKKLVDRLTDKETETRLLDALEQDLGRVGIVALGYDILPTIAECRKMIAHLDEYAAPKWLGISMMTAPSIDFNIPEPYGTVFVNGIWNFPVNLVLSPMIGAIAAGNNVIIKPCNECPNVSRVIADIIHESMDGRFVSVIGHPDNQSTKDDRRCTDTILNNRFDKIFFTGSSNGGKYVLSKAAKYLTPVILELGGKNPVFVDDTANLKQAANQLVFARSVNCGQQCISPDYVFCDERVIDKFCDALKCTVESMFPNDYLNDKNQSFLVNDQQYQRVNDMLQSSQASLICGGKSDAKTRKFEVTIMKLTRDQIKEEDDHLGGSLLIKDESMKQETFGPILWVIPVKDLKKAVEYVKNEQEKSLSLYVFSNDKKMVDYIIYNTSAGGVQVNGTIVYVAHSAVKFGGVGHSGMGGYHGRHSFEAFTHYKPVIKSLMEIDLFYPPWIGRTYVEKLIRYVF